jgi:hypothetical protein
MPAWKPTPENIMALPEPIRQYIHDLQTVCDPAGDIQMLYILRQENRALRFECERLAKKAGEMPKPENKPRRSRLRRRHRSHAPGQRGRAPSRVA